MGCIQKKPTYGGGSINSSPQGGSISPGGSTIKESILLIDEFANFIVTEANEKIIIDEAESTGFISAVIKGQPNQGGSVSQPTQGGSVSQPTQGGSISPSSHNC